MWLINIVYGGQYFNGYAPKYGKSPKSNTASKKVCTIGKLMKKTRFTTGSYKQFSKLKGYIIYCDPPYVGFKCNYKLSFNNEEFWKWCDKMAVYNVVFVSGYNAPKNIQSIFKSKHKLTGTGVQGNKNRVEKLYILY